MERALVIGASGGIGTAMMQALEARGAEVVGLSRSADGLDITKETSVTQTMGSLAGPFDLIFVATGALTVNGSAPEKSIGALSADALRDQFEVNAIGPALVLQHALRLLAKDGRTVIAVLSARVGSIGDNRIGGWHAYRASKAALNQLVHGAAIELKRTHKQAVCVSLHPGTVATEFTAKYAGRHTTVPASEAAQNLLSVIDGLTPGQSGGFYDYAGETVPW